jgi:hypothetical protein
MTLIDGQNKSFEQGTKIISLEYDAETRDIEVLSHGSV